MNEQKIQEYKQRLETELQELTTQLQATGRKLNEEGDWIAVPGEIDKETPEFDEVADNIEQFESDIAVLNVIEKRYGDVTKALERIENNTYGICAVSGEPIPLERIEADPAAATLVEHADSAE